MSYFSNLSLRLSRYSSLVLRIGIAFVFIWFGWSGLMEPQRWISLVPTWTASIAPALTLVRAHGIFELLFGLLLFFGYAKRLASALLFASLIQTLTLLEFGPIMVRDIGLALATLAIFLRGKEL